MQKPEFFAAILETGVHIQTLLEFNRAFGFGTSSTLIANLGQWSGVDPFRLSERSFGGSGYDIACASAQGPILYQRQPNHPQFVHCPFNPPFKDQLYLVYLGQKQDSREGIQLYRQQSTPDQSMLDWFSQAAIDLVAAKDLLTFNAILEEHESRVSQHIGLPKVRDRYFKDYWGTIKSLGAWGGDFVLATSDRGASDTLTYFKQKGFRVVFEFGELAI